MNQETKLPTSRKLLYASGSLGGNVVFQSLTLWLIYFYAPPPESGLEPLLPIALIGLLLGLGRFIEAFDDPVIGHWSDTMRSRFGRRAPFILLGAPATAVTFVLLWTPPPGTSVPILALYFFVVLELYYLAYTLVMAPFEALLPEVARTSKERVSVAAWKVVFGASGAAIGLVTSGILAARFGFVVMGATMAVIACLSFWVSLLGIRGLQLPAASEQPLPLLTSLRTTLAHKQFLAFATSVVLFLLGQNMLTQLVPYFVTVVLGLGKEQTSLILGGVIGLVLLALPLMSRLAALRSKGWAYSLAMATLVVYFPFIFFVGFLQGIPKLAQGVVLLSLVGIPMSALYVFPNALLADVIDHDSLRTGQRREAVYFGMFATLQKLAYAISAALFGLILNTFGYAETNPLGIRLIGPISGLCVLAGWLIFVKWYTLPDTVLQSSESAAKR